MIKINPSTLIGAMIDTGEPEQISGGTAQYYFDDACVIPYLSKLFGVDADAARVFIYLDEIPEITQITLLKADDCTFETVGTYEIDEDYTLRYTDQSRQTATRLIKEMVWSAVSESLIFKH